MKEDFAEELQQVERVYVRSGRRKLFYFGGCDYYRLSSDPRIAEALREGLQKYGLNTAASRKTTGNHPIYDKVEKATAKYFGAESAVLVSSGYLSNIAVGEILRGEITHALMDARCHGSLRDAVALAGARVILFAHRDPADLKRKLKTLSGRSARIVVITDGIFAFDGSIAPVREYREVIGPDALLWVDDAHAAGILGQKGQGTLEHAGVSRENLIQTITFSKAFGVYGGAVLGNVEIRQRLIARSSAVSGNTPLPLPLACAVLAGIGLLNKALRERLSANIDLFWNRFTSGPATWRTPIAGPAVKNPRLLKEKLLAAGIYPSFIRYPGGPEQGYFRFALSSEHSEEQITRLAEVLRKNA